MQSDWPKVLFHNSRTRILPNTEFVVQCHHLMRKMTTMLVGKVVSYLIGRPKVALCYLSLDKRNGNESDWFDLAADTKKAKTDIIKNGGEILKVRVNFTNEKI